MVIRIGTRKSKLAMIQTELVKTRIEAQCPDIQVEIVPMSTKGDEILDRSLTSFGGKGVFTKELEEALLCGWIDMAVHSAKDMPMEFPKELCIGAVLEREDARDVLVTLHGTPAVKLSPGSIIGTSSLRRELQIKNLNPLVRIKLLRGNVQTRLAKLERGEYDGILLAAAGLRRLALQDETRFHFEYLTPEEFVPAAGQGILAVEIRREEPEASQRDAMRNIMERIHDKEAGWMLAAERRFLAVLGGGCNAPCAAYSRITGDTFHMQAMYETERGQLLFRSMEGPLPKEEQSAEEMGERLAGQVMLRKVSLVGAGPGDASLISEKGLACIREAEVLVYDNLISSSFLNEAPLGAELIYAGKRASHHHLKQEDTNRLLIQKALEGKKVVRIKGGDPFIFGRGGEEAQALKQAGIPFEIVPGISSSYAVAAYAGIPITHRDAASSFHVITGHEGKQKQQPVLDYATLAREEGTLVFMMGLGNLESIAEALMENGKDPNTPAAVIQQGTTSRQRTVTAPLKTIAAKAAEEGIKTPAVTVVGEVAKYRDELAWYEDQPLFGRKILLTGTKAMTEKLCRELSPLGAETVQLSLIYTRPIYTEELEKTVQSIKDYSWLVFTSSNGVELFFEYIQSIHMDLRKLSDIRFAVIGRGTKESLEKKGFFCDFEPDTYSSEALAQEWIPSLKKEDRILMLRAAEASKVLPEKLREAGIAYQDTALYETAVDMRKNEELNRILPDMDYITFASASAVRAFGRMTDKQTEYDGKVICIGPVTEKAALKQGITVFSSAAEYTARGIRDVIWKDSLSD